MNEILVRQMLAVRTLLLIVVHTLVLTISYEIAFQLRFDMQLPEVERALFWMTLPWVLLTKLVIFHRFGSFHGWWRYVTFSDLAALLRASAMSSLLLCAIDYFFFPSFQVPHSVVILDWGVTIVLIGGLRSTWRILREHILYANGKQPALMVGVGSQVDLLVRQIQNHPKLNYRIVGFLDENNSHLGTYLGGIPFLAGVDKAVETAQKHGAQEILLQAQSIPGGKLRRLMDDCRKAGIRLKVIPSLDELLHDSYRAAVRDVDINDLLRRQPVQLDTQEITRMIAGKRVMVTGAGGSIGSEICRQITLHQPESLILVERFENNLFQIERELVGKNLPFQVVPCIADIRDEDRMQAVFRQTQPQIIFHAAAHKHVPLMESNPGEAIKNNVLGTIALVDLAEAYDVERFVMISTDKAVNPTSIMGVTKHLAERYVHACSETSSTKFVAVRFGNVLASAGSVVPIFQEQIRKGGPVTVTHPEMRRYFMTIPEASQLVLQAASMGDGGEIFVLDMGEPVKILDLAQDLIRLSGLSLEDIDIDFTGVRPGEKLYEELYLDDEETRPTPHPKLKVAYHRSYTREEVLSSIEDLVAHMYDDVETIREKLKKIAPEYSPPPSTLALRSQASKDQLALGQS